MYYSAIKSVLLLPANPGCGSSAARDFNTRKIKIRPLFASRNGEKDLPRVGGRGGRIRVSSTSSVALPLVSTCSENTKH